MGVQGGIGSGPARPTIVIFSPIYIPDMQKLLENVLQNSLSELPASPLEAHYFESIKTD